jgi:chaperonin cofactor prefoldin
MNDYIDELDHAKTFENKRYIIRVSPDIQTDDDGTDIITHVGNIGQAITSKQDANQKQILKKINVFEKSTRTLMKNQANSIMEIKQLIAEISPMIKDKKKADDKADEDEM